MKEVVPALPSALNSYTLWQEYQCIWQLSAVLDGFLHCLLLLLPIMLDHLDHSQVFTSLKIHFDTAYENRVGVVELTDSTFWYHHIHLKSLKRAQLILKLHCTSATVDQVLHILVWCVPSSFGWLTTNLYPICSECPFPATNSCSCCSWSLYLTDTWSCPNVCSLLPL